MEELKVLADFYDFLLWLVQHTGKFPRHHRYSLGLAIEARMQTILALLLRAKYAKGAVKSQHLSEVNLELEVLRFQLRLAKDLRALPIKSHEYAAKALLGIGAQVGAWLRSQGERT